MLTRWRPTEIVANLALIGLIGSTPAGAIGAVPPQSGAKPEVHLVNVDEDGNLDDSDRKNILEAITDRKPTDVFLFSHGWLNAGFQAQASYDKLRDKMSALADARHLRPEGFRPFLIGIHWPSTDFDKQFQDFDALVTKRMIPLGVTPSEDAKVDQTLAASLTAITEPDSPKKAKAATKPGLIDRFRSVLVQSKGKDPRESLNSAYGVFVEQSNILRMSLQGGDLNKFARMAEGRIADVSTLAQAHTFWKMRMRAGVVGSNGVHSLIASIQKGESARPSIHLIGHSFGCKVVMAAITAAPGLPRPVRSVVLLQGAVSDQSFEDEVADLDREGPYRIAKDPRVVQGPIVATSSREDMALSDWFPRASLLGRQIGEWNDPVSLETMIRLKNDPRKFDLLLAALGGGTKGSPMKAVGMPYDFGAPGTLSRINGNEFIKGGRPPGGAHSEIYNDEVAWLIWSAALKGREGPR